MDARVAMVPQQRRPRCPEPQWRVRLERSKYHRLGRRTPPGERRAHWYAPQAAGWPVVKARNSEGGARQCERHDGGVAQRWRVLGGRVQGAVLPAFCHVVYLV